MKIKKLFLIGACFVPTFVVLSCSSSDDDTSEPTPVEGEKEEYDPLKSNDSTAFNVDKTFKPSTSYIQKRWAGEYTGWDAVQKKNTKIVRMLTLNAGTYTNVIQGELVNSGKSMYKFESESGTYTYNASTGVITYRVDVDSVIVYDKQDFNVYKEKHYYDHTKPTYTENARFSVLTNGKRNWITKDTYLQSLTAEKIDITFDMVEDTGKPKER